MKMARIEVESDGDFKYDKLFSIMCHEDKKILFKSVMENLLFIGVSIESSRYDISNFKKTILNFANAYLKEGKEEYFNYDRELYYNAKYKEVSFGLDWGNWSIYVEIDDIKYKALEDGFIINIKG